jgi:hypothetical protein
MHQRVEYAAYRFGAITHFGFEGDVLLHVVHCTGFGDNRLARVELNLDYLHVIAKNFVIDFMALHECSP